MEPHDVVGQAICEGSTVVRAVIRGNSPAMEVCTVTKVENGKVYLDNSPRAVIYTDRLCVITL